MHSVTPDDSKAQRQERSWTDGGPDPRDAWMDDMIPVLSPRVWLTGRPACVGLGVELFFGGPPKKALKVCRECPVRLECLQWALDNEDEHGIQGGVTQVDRLEFAGNTAKRMIELADEKRLA